MDSALRNFEKRKKTVRRKHTRMARGYVTKMNREGLMVQRPDNKVGGFAKRLLFLAIIGFVGFKTLLLAGLGEADYIERVATLENGSVYEQAGAFLMQIDPVTKVIADLVSPYIADVTIAAAG